MRHSIAVTPKHSRSLLSIGSANKPGHMALSESVNKQFRLVDEKPDLAVHVDPDSTWPPNRCLRRLLREVDHLATPRTHAN